MGMRRRLVCLASSLVLAIASFAQSPELPPLRAAVDRMVAELHLQGCGLAVVREGQVLHRSEHGTFAHDEVLSVASASKWLAVATILTLVDEGKLDLDVPVARYVKEFERPDKNTITLRQCLSHTSGLPPRLNARMRGWDSAKFAAAAADAPMRDSPAAAFQYGGVSMQVAAIAAERVTGKSWHDLFAERIAGPLGMRDTKFGTLLPVGGDAGTTTLPWVAGGAVSTLDDYATFVRMLVTQGRVGDRQILQPETIAGMFRDHVPSLVEVKAVGFDADSVRYGLGTWIEDLGKGAVSVSDPGAFGFTPWIELDLGVGGVFAVRDRVNRVLPRLRRLQEEVRTTVQSPLVAGVDSTVNLAHGGRDRRYHLHVPPQAANAAGLPLVVVLHGGGGNGEYARDSMGFDEVADREGFVVAYPDGTGALRGKLLTWNSGGIPVYAVEHNVEDVAFLREVVADVQRKVAIDPTRVFAAGHSNGGMMCHRLAREAADLFAGVAVVSGAMNFTAKDSPEPIGVLLVHGTADGNVRYEGGTPRDSTGRSGERVDASVQDAIDYYLDRNGLRGYPETKTDGKVRLDSYATNKDGKPSSAPLRVITLEGGGHAWPGMPNQARPGADRPFPFPTAREIWLFFVELRRAPGSPSAPQGR